MKSYQITRGSRFSRVAMSLVGISFLLLILAPTYVGRGWLGLLSEFFCLLTLAMLWNILAGFAGLVSVGQQTYVGIGGYASFVMMKSLSISPIAAIALSGFFGAAFAVPCALLLFRLKGPYFAIGSWVIAEVFRLSALQTPQLGGAVGISLPANLVRSIATTPQSRATLIYSIAVLLAVATLAILYAMLRSRFGLALTAIRDNELASESLGIETRRTKLGLYIGVAAATAMAGSVIFLQKLRITPDAAFNVNDFTAFVIFIAVIGGVGSLEGPILGTVLFFVFRETMSELGTIYLMALGALAIGIMLKAPKGLWGILAERFEIEIFAVRRRIVQRSSAD